MYETTEDVFQDLKKAGLDSSELIFEIDYTKSNGTNGCFHSLRFLVFYSYWLMDKSLRHT